MTVALPLLSSVMVKAAAVVSGWAGSDHGNCFENHDATVIAPPSASHVLLSRASGLLVEELLPMLLAQVPKILPTERTARVRFRAQAPSGHGYGGSGAVSLARDVAAHAADDAIAFVHFASCCPLRHHPLLPCVRQRKHRAPAACLPLACSCALTYAERVPVYLIPMGSLRPTFPVSALACAFEHVLVTVLSPRCANLTPPSLMVWLQERTILPAQRVCVVRWQLSSASTPAGEHFAASTAVSTFSTIIVTEASQLQAMTRAQAQARAQARNIHQLRFHQSAQRS